MQEHFEAILFNVMRTRGFGDEYVDRYKMVTKFFQQRRPLIVLICGVPCTGAWHYTYHVSRFLDEQLLTGGLAELLRRTERAGVRWSAACRLLNGCAVSKFL